MTTDLTIIDGNTAVIPLALRELSADRRALLRKTAASGCADDTEFELFIEVCRHTGLDPFARQIYAINRGGKMTIQTGIDGYRLVAQRSGDYAGQEGPQWCGDDGDWRDVWLAHTPPAAARVGVWRRGWQSPVWGVALTREYAEMRDGKATGMWARMPALMIAKCFDPETEVLTERGFMKFAEVKDERIMQVTSAGLEPVQSAPFRQDYSGPMVNWHSDDLDFCVTPNHDMVTTVGKVEAGAMFETSHNRGPWDIPRIVPAARTDATISDEQIRLSAWVLADGSHGNGTQWRIGVGRLRKVEAIRALGLAVYEGVKHSRDAVAVSRAGREIKSNFDQAIFTFDAPSAPMVAPDKSVEMDWVLSLSSRQARVFVDTWIEADGHENKKTGVRRLYTSRPDHARAFEVAAVIAGYSINKPKERWSDISNAPNLMFTISGRDKIPVRRHSGADGRPTLFMDANTSGDVWCVTVPSGQIVVRRNGFSMVCGNCAEVLAIRKAFPVELAGIYTAEEMVQPDNPAPIVQRQEQRPRSPQPSRRAEPVTPAGPFDADPHWIQDLAEAIRISGVWPPAPATELVLGPQGTPADWASALKRWAAKLGKGIDPLERILAAINLPPPVADAETGEVIECATTDVQAETQPEVFRD